MALLDPPRVHLHDGAGRRIGRLTTASSINRSYVTHEPAAARIDVAWNEPLLAELDPRRGRILVIESDAYPYPWVGMLTRPSWAREGGILSLTAKSLDGILTRRYVSGTFSGTAGSVWARVLAASDNPTGISVGSYVDGPAYSTTLNDRSIFAALTAIAQESAHEWWTDYLVSPSEIVARANFRPARGQDRCRGAALIDGANATWTDAQVDGEAAAFALTIVGGVSSVTEAYGDRPRTRRQSVAGVRGDAVIAPGRVHGHPVERFDIATSPLTRGERIALAEARRSQGDVEGAAQYLLERPLAAERSMRWTVLAKAGAVDWSAYEVGSVVRASAPDAFWTGFEGDVRIVAAQPHEAAGTMDLVTQIVGDCEGE